jgi:hypothetical protein
MILSSSDPRLRYLYALCIALGLVWVNFLHFQNIPYLTLALSNAIVVLGATPLFFWLKNQQREAIPLLPMHGFFYVITFGIAGFYRFEKSIFEDWRFQIQNDIFAYALTCVIAGLLSLYFAYYVVAPKLLRRVEKASLFPFYIKGEKAYVLLAWIGFPVSCLLYWLSQEGAVAYLRPSFQIMYQFIFYLLMAAYFKGLLSTSTKVVLLTVILPYQFFIGSVFLEGSIGVLITNIVAICILFFAIQQRMPWGWMALIILIILLIQPIKGELRDRIWQLNEAGTSLQLKQGTTVVDSFREISNVLSNRYVSGDGGRFFNLKDVSKASYVRMNRLTTLVEVIDLTPNPQPYRYGSTYTPLLTKWIPRILWENKPRETLGNDWVRAYGLASPHDYAYSYNLPWIAEMYMNFGFLGVLGVSFLIGLLFYVFKVTICQTGSDPTKLAFGVLLVVPLMFPESHLSLVLGGVIVGGVLLIFLTLLATKLFPNMFSTSLHT